MEEDVVGEIRWAPGGMEILRAEEGKGCVAVGWKGWLGASGSLEIGYRAN